MTLGIQRKPKAATAQPTTLEIFVPPQFFLISWALSGIVGLAITIIAVVRHHIPAWLMMLFAIAEGVFIGGFSRFFEMRYPGIVIQAVLGTFVAAGVTLFAYKFFNIRTTPRFRKILFLATASFAGIALVNFVLSFFIPGGLGLRSGDNPMLAIGFAALGAFPQREVCVNKIKIINNAFQGARVQIHDSFMTAAAATWRNRSVTSAPSPPESCVPRKNGCLHAALHALQCHTRHPLSLVSYA